MLQDKHQKKKKSLLFFQIGDKISVLTNIIIPQQSVEVTCSAANFTSMVRVNNEERTNVKHQQAY